MTLRSVIYTPHLGWSVGTIDLLLIWGRRGAVELKLRAERPSWSKTFTERIVV